LKGVIRICKVVKHALLFHCRRTNRKGIGFLVLAVILFLEFLPFEAIGEISAAKRFGLFLLGGLWISFIWPYLTDRKQGERFKTFHSTQLITRK